MDKRTNSIDINDLKKLLGRRQGSWSDFFASWFKRPSYIIIVATNIGIFFIPGLEVKTQYMTILWIYLVQSLMIGAMHFIKLMTYKFAPPSRPEDWKNPRAIAFFFLVHYGFFHFVYSFFLPPSGADWNLVWQGAAVFGFALIVNTIQHFQKENSGKYNANDFMFLPYVRIFPIHIAIILGGFFSIISGNPWAVVVILMILKMAMELLLEYLQQLGVSFGELAHLKKEEKDETN